MLVGYRYGKAPENGKSYNTRDGRTEAGVSMASISGSPECNSFATLAAKEGRQVYYYAGNYAGTGSDDEYLLADVVKITAAEYKKTVKNEENTAKKTELRAEVCRFYMAELTDLNKKIEEIIKSNLEDWQVFARYGKTLDKMTKDAEYFVNKINKWD